MNKPIGEMTYDELIAAIDKADKLDVQIRAKHMDRYRALCLAASEREMDMRKFPAHGICDPDLREIAGRLLRNTCALSKTEDFRAACLAILSDLMALCLTDTDRVLDMFGYKEVVRDGQ